MKKVFLVLLLVAITLPAFSQVWQGPVWKLPTFVVGGVDTAEFFVKIPDDVRSDSTLQVVVYQECDSLPHVKWTLTPLVMFGRRFADAKTMTELTLHTALNDTSKASWFRHVPAENDTTVTNGTIHGTARHFNGARIRATSPNTNTKSITGWVTILGKKVD